MLERTLMSLVVTRCQGRFDQDEAFKASAYEEVVKLQARDPEVTEVWQLICEVSRQGRLGMMC
jgi:arginyl-tRNA synthetase